MPCENSARKRSKTMAFRCTPEEYELIASMAAWSGMSRQDYIMARLTGTEVTVRPSSRTQRALRDSMKELAERLLAVGDQGNQRQFDEKDIYYFHLESSNQMQHLGVVNLVRCSVAQAFARPVVELIVHLQHPPFADIV